MSDLKIYMMRIDTLEPYINNPRNNSKAIDPVARSIERYGWRVPIVCDRDRVILAGHTRYEAAKKLGLEEVPVVIADELTYDQAKAFRLADNKTAEIARWDYQRLEDELAMIDADEWIDRLFARKHDGDAAAVESTGELDLDMFDDEEFAYVCPCCGFKFNK